MEFVDLEIEKLDLTNPKDMVKCFGSLCDQALSIRKEDSELLKKLTGRFSKKAKSDGIRFEQFNEILLPLNQVRIGEGFFIFFFNSKKETITLEAIKNGVKKFRGYAMLCYGNFGHAYQIWVEMTKEDIEKDVRINCCLFKNDEAVFDNRGGKLMDIEKIPKDKLKNLGYVSQVETQKDVINIMSILHKIDNKNLNWDILDKKTKNKILSVEKTLDKEKIAKWSPLVKQFGKELDKRQEEMQELEKIAINNTNIYLTWDYMDIYVATSMRESWEYEDVYEFVNMIFNHKDIINYNLRFFDPTQSWVKDRIQKGLIEALMLKRASITFYLAQETDSLGKDSELAITLAQGKPVIAYIPEIDVEKHKKKIAGYPLKFFRKRISVLEAEDILPELKSDIEEIISTKAFDELEGFKDKLGEYFSKRTFVLNLSEEDEFKKKHQEAFMKICEIIAIAEQSYFNKRADLLKRVHPLGLQVDLKTGVANGVLVARNVGQCIELLKSLLTGNIKFKIENRENGVYLIEEVTESCFRVVTKNEKITNSFWNFYLR